MPFFSEKDQLIKIYWYLKEQIVWKSNMQMTAVTCHIGSDKMFIFYFEGPVTETYDQVHVGPVG